MLIWQVVVQTSWTYLPPICASYLLRSQTPCQDGLHQGAWRDHHQCVPRHSGQISQSGDVRQRQPQNGMDILEGNGSEITSHLSFLASSTLQWAAAWLCSARRMVLILLGCCCSNQRICGNLVKTLLLFLMKMICCMLSAKVGYRMCNDSYKSISICF